MCSLAPESVRSSFQNAEVNTRSQLETSDSGMPCRRTILAKNAFATVLSVQGWPSEMKWQYLENQFTTVKMTDLPLTFGSPSMKSSATSAQTTDGKGRGRSTPPGRRCSVLYCWQVRQPQTKSYTTKQRLGAWKLRRSWCRVR